MEGRLFAEFRALAEARHRLPALDDAVPTYVIDPGELTVDGSVFCYRRGGFGFLALANFADDDRRVELAAVGPRPFTLDRHSHGVALVGTTITLPARGFAWLLD